MDFAARCSTKLSHVDQVFLHFKLLVQQDVHIPSSALVQAGLRLTANPTWAEGGQPGNADIENHPGIPPRWSIKGCPSHEKTFCQSLHRVPLIVLVTLGIVFMMSSSSVSSPLFLGFDASTQALKASLLSSNLDVIAEQAVNFDADLPHYKTQSGVLHGPEGSGEVFSPVMMIVEAMDLLLDRIHKAGWKVGDIRGVAAAGQVSTSI